MKDPYPLVRALEVINSINLDVMGLPKAYLYAKETAKKGLDKYNQQVQPVPIRSQLLQDISHDAEIQDCNQG